MHQFDDPGEAYYNEEGDQVRSITPLERTQPDHPEEVSPANRDPESGRPTITSPDKDPGLQVLFINHCLNPVDDSPDPDPSGSSSGSSDHVSEDRTSRNSIMSGQAAAIQPSDVPAATQPTLLPQLSRPTGTSDPASVVTAPAALNVEHVVPSEAGAQQARDANLLSREDSVDLVARPRVDSAQQGIPGVSPPNRAPQTPQRSPLKLETVSPRQKVYDVDLAGESIRNSPDLSKRMIPVAEGTANTLPAVHAISPVKAAAVTSPQSLPSFKQFTGELVQLNEQNHLRELAEAATTQEARAPASSNSHHHSQSLGSTTSQSPINPYYAHSNASHASPLNISITAKSPMSTISDGLSYGSPQQQAAYHAYYTDRRRSSTNVDHPPTFPPPLPNLSSIPSTSSSGESRGRATSSADSYTTSHTTPIEAHLPADGTPRPVPVFGPAMSGPFKCDYPDCNNAFGTQYLLSSHKTVHSQSRPHYCPVKNCSRGEGGKGFKRKNEMIRHGLVHSSPGYMCPFCPERNHKYPRPDNLQRHVRVHHVDKDKDDPELREVLSQRAEGTGKARRRRTQGSISSV